MTRKVVLSIIGAFVLYSCSNVSEEVNSSQQHNAVATDTAELFAGTDSLELIYYPIPAEQKDYAFAMSSDSQLIATLMSDLQGESVERSPCPHYKKAYLFNGGEVYKTVYISDSCNYLAFAVNGQPQYKRLSDTTRSRMETAYKTVLKKLKG